MNSGTVNEKSENNNSVVLTEDNAWFVCDSRSRPGLKYYFNKLTGIKVWNITEAEIELAKKFGKNSAEPVDLPMDQQNDANFHDKQIISNQFSKQLPNMLGNPTPFINADRDHSQVDLQPQIQAQQYYTLVPAAIAPLINQIAVNASLQQAYQQLLQLPNTFHNIPPNNLNLLGPISQYAPIQQPHLNIPRNKNQRYRKNKWIRNRNVQENNLNSQSDSYNTSDLRQKLVRKRRFSESGVGSSEQDCYGEEDSVQNNNCNHSKIKIEHELQETSTRLDLTPLKQMTASGSNSDMWYIVVDKCTILNNYNYLNNMIGSDVNCQLLIPHHVVKELKRHSLDSTNVQARRILRFLSQQIESGFIKVGLDDETEEQDLHKTLLTCVKLAMQSNNVVLITNVEEILKLKHNYHGIHIFTIEEIKDILARKTIRHRAASPTLAIKITVPNITQNTERKHDLPHLSAQTNPASFHDVDTVFQTKDLTGQSSLESSIKQSSAPILDTTKAKEVRLTRSVSEYRQTKERSPKQFKWRMKKGRTHSPNDKTNSPVASQTRLETDATKNIATMNIHTSTQNSPVKLPKTNSNTNDDLPKSPIASQEVPKLSNLTNDIASFKQTRTQNSPTKFQRTTSNMSISDNDNTSEVSVFKSIPNGNITVPETSISGVSNTESSFSEKIMAPYKQNSVKVKVRKVFMFEVAYQNMNDVLKTRCDEWVSRFVQIMEEILREKLQEDPPFENKEYPPPWNLQEAARCIIKKFSENFNIVDAANKLSFILYKICDEHGKIPEIIEPTDYMEMYSYGVYLVETLQDISSNCEDLKTASDSLKKLLYDIQNDSLDPSHQDPFTDNPHELGMDGTNREFDRTEVDKDAPNYPTTELMEIDFFKSSDPASYNLQSQKGQSKIARNEEQPPNLKLLTKENESTFFDSLKLKKILMDQAEVQKEAVTLNDPINMTSFNQDSITMPVQLKSPEKMQQTDPDIKVHVNDSDIAVTPQTKIIRKFTKFEEFEKRLKEKQLDSDHEYYSEDNECDDNDGQTEVDQEESVENDKNEIAPVIVKNTVRIKNFLRFMGRLVRRLGDVFTQVKVQCNDYVMEVIGPQQSGFGTRMQLREKVEKACSLIETVRDALDSIINRDIDKDNNIQRLLEIANVEDFIPDDTVCLQYRDVITSCKHRAEFFLNSLRNILKIVRA